ERRAVVAVLFRFKLRRRADFHRAPVHRAAADATLTAQRTPTPSALSFPALKAEACRAPGQVDKGGKRFGPIIDASDCRQRSPARPGTSPENCRFDPGCF